MRNFYFLPDSNLRQLHILSFIQEQNFGIEQTRILLIQPNLFWLYTVKKVLIHAQESTNFKTLQKLDH